MKMTATWLQNQDIAYDVPISIRWEDGRIATYEEFCAHYGDTSFMGETQDGSQQMHIFPDVVAEAYYCPYGHIWGLRGDGVEPVTLGLTDANATDQEIGSAVLRLSMLYRINIRR